MNDFLHKILLSENIVEMMRNNIEELCHIIPEISSMIGFSHNNPNHHLDVWEHTLCALSFSPNDFDIRLTLLLHDIGKPHSFQDDGKIRHFKGHPEASTKIANSILSRLGYEKKYIEYICKLISHHDTGLTEEEIKNDLQFSKTLFEIQKCDAFAHNPENNVKRLEYVNKINKLIFKNGETNEKIIF